MTDQPELALFDDYREEFVPGHPTCYACAAASHPDHWTEPSYCMRHGRPVDRVLGWCSDFREAARC